MSAAHDLTGVRFGRLVVVERATRRVPGAALWTCRCDCGARHMVRAYSLQNGDTRSCGCARAENARRQLAAMRKGAACGCSDELNPNPKETPTMSDRIVVRVSPETDKQLRAYAERKGMTLGEAADALVGTAVARLEAVSRWAKSNPKKRKGAET